MAAATEALPFPPPPPSPSQAESSCQLEQRAAVEAPGRRQWVCQLRRARGCLPLLAVLVRAMLPALEEKQEAGGDVGEEGQHGAGGAAADEVNAKAALGHDTDMEALFLCLRVWCQLAAVCLHAGALHLHQEAQGAQGLQGVHALEASVCHAAHHQQPQGMHQADAACSREVLTKDEVYGAVGDVLALMQALGVCAAEAPQQALRQLLAAQPSGWWRSAVRCGWSWLGRRLRRGGRVCRGEPRSGGAVAAAGAAAPRPLLLLWAVGWALRWGARLRGWAHAPSCGRISAHGSAPRQRRWKRRHAEMPPVLRLLMRLQWQRWSTAG